MSETRDDRVLPTTRWVSALIVPVLVSAFVILWFFPGPVHTKDLWAWTIKAEMTAMFMGGGYLAGAYFFVRVVTTTEGHRALTGFLAITVFTTLLLLSTILHWDTFNHSHVSFWAWILLYVVTPPLLPLLWWTNRATDPGTPKPDDPRVPTPVRVMVGGTGAVLVLFAVVMFVRPTAFVADWPWPITPLTARVIAAFISFPAVSWLLVAADRRWSSHEFPIQTATIGLVLIIVSTIRASGEFDGTAGAYAAVLCVALAYLLGLQLFMARRAAALRPAAGDSPPGP